MVGFKDYLNEAGQDVGKMELVKTDVTKAAIYGSKAFTVYGRDMEEEIPNFSTNYPFAQKQAGTGSTQRKDMPVIDESDVKTFQARLSDGYIDINKPFGAKSHAKNPFPDGLSGAQAQQWLEDGMKKNDGDANDDKVSLKKVKVTVGNLKPIQKQIYFDKSIEGCAEFGYKGTVDFLTKHSTFIISADNYIIDGHHRYLSGILLNPKMKVTCIMIDLPIKELLPLTLSYSDAIGNKRNA